MNALYNHNLSRVLAHTVVWESQNPERAVGVPAGWFRNDFGGWSDPFAQLYNGMTPETPPPQNYGDQTRQTLQAQIDLAPQKYASEAQYRPKYAALDMSIASSSLPGTLNLAEQAAPRIGEMQRKNQSQQRAGDIADVQALAGASRTAYEQLNPEGAALLKRTNELRMAELENPYSMSASQRRESEQNVRGAQSVRGMGMGPTDAFQESMYLGDRQRGLYNERMQGASQAIGQNQSFYGDPFQQILGRTSGANPQSYVNQAQGFNPGSQFNPESAYARDIYDTNYNAQAAVNIAAANNKAGLGSSLASY